MHKIVKRFGYGFKDSEPVTIKNEIYIPKTEEEKTLSADELKKLEYDRKTEEEKAFRASVDAEVGRILKERSAELEEQRGKIITAAKKQAEAMAADAKSTTLSVLEKTAEECSRLKVQAEREGYKKGLQQGHDESIEKCRKYVDSAAKLLSEINSRKEAYYVSNEKELRDTVNVMVEKIVKAELEVNPLVIERIIADAARNFRNSDYLKISVSGGELIQKIKTDKNLMNRIIPFIKDIEVEIIEDAPDGTIILDDEETIVDASIPTQLDFLKEIMKNTRGEE